MGVGRMRIVAGTLGGRRIAAPPGTATRPTSDRVREAVFSRLDAVDAVHGASVLDLFAGSGALGLEALSRGAVHATFVENGRQALGALQRNISDLGVARSVTVVTADAFPTSKRQQLPGAPFSLLFVDPPYRIDRSKIAGAIAVMAGNGQLKAGGHVVWEYATGDPVIWPSGFESLGERRYGSTAVDVAVFAAGGEDE